MSLPSPPKILSLEVLPQSAKSNGAEANGAEVLDVSAIDTVAVDPTCKERAESAYSFMESA